MQPELFHESLQTKIDRRRQLFEQQSNITRQILKLDLEIKDIKSKRLKQEHGY